MRISHAAHLVSDHAHRHPLYCAGEAALVAAGMVLAATLLVSSLFAQTAPMARAMSSEAQLESASQTPQWVWQKRSSADNGVYAFGTE